jgi:putative spermidine/putrescine transport system ATP-binding protein
MSTLTLVDLTKHFGAVGRDKNANTVNAVNQVNLHVEHGEFVCILGPSGCGKSTALRMIAGFETPSSGDVLIDGASVAELPANKRPTAMVFQKYTLWPHMRIYDNIAFGLRLRNLTSNAIDEKVNEALQLVGLASYGPRYPSQLSGGEQQRIALARALVLQPKILLLDEPFSNLDALLRVRLREELHRIQRRLGITAVFVTHDQEEALSLADRIAVMNKGRVEQLDKPSNIYDSPQTLFVADFIGTMNLIPGTLTSGAVKLGSFALPTTNAASAVAASGAVTVAIRPEDIGVTHADHPEAWLGQIEQIIDLGHYRKALVTLPGVGTAKVYLSKAHEGGEGDTLPLFVRRFLIYHDGAPPIEVRRQIDAAVATFSA